MHCMRLFIQCYFHCFICQALSLDDADNFAMQKYLSQLPFAIANWAHTHQDCFSESVLPSLVHAEAEPSHIRL